MGEEKLTMKILEGRLNRLKRETEERLDRLEDHIRQIELDSARPDTSVVSDTPEYARDILVASINALKNQRSQGALRMAQELENKYFDGEDMQEIGDRLTDSGGIWSATKGL